MGSIFGTNKRDTLFATKYADSVYGLGGNDRLYGLSGQDQLFGGAGNDRLFGGNSGDRLYGGLGNDVLTGSKGRDVLIGGQGNDTYIADSKHDRVIERPNQGTDTIKSSVSLKLPRNVENLTLLGHQSHKATGNDLDNVLIGNTAHNVLDGGAGNDWLDGGRGADSMSGGNGNDTYVIDNPADTVSEHAGAGTDWVIAALTYVLTANVENLTLSGSAAINGFGNGLDNVIAGNAAANLLDGGAGNDTLYGGAGNDTLTGGTGADRLYGGDGNDIYIVSGAGDSIVDSSGIDEIRTQLAAYNLGAGIENLTFTGLGNFNGTGNALDNRVAGGSNDDTLTGGLGADTLTGGAGADHFVFALFDTATDTIADFVQSSDFLSLRIAELTSVFAPQTAIYDAGLAQNLFNVNGFTGAQLDTRAQFVFDTAAGALWLDSDGTGPGHATLIAKLTGVHAALTAADFEIL